MASAPGLADEPLVGFTYTTDMLPKGKIEVEQWATFREGRSQGDFHLLETREELSFGLRDNLQVSGYLNLAHTSVSRDGADGRTVPPAAFADYGVDPLRRFSKSRFESVSLEGIYRIASPYTAFGGAALYAQPSIGPNFRELDARLIVQKNFADDRLVIAGNAGLVFGWRRILDDSAATDGRATADDGHWEHETTVVLSSAASYRFISNWNVGAEFRNERPVAGHDPFDGGRALGSAYYAGPSLHYGGQHVFATLTALFQLPIAADFTASPAVSEVVDGLSNALAAEKLRLRLKLGYYF